eukprot:108564-Chlamydomonas_euryale.AAC.1
MSRFGNFDVKYLRHMRGEWTAWTRQHDSMGTTAVHPEAYRTPGDMLIAPTKKTTPPALLEPSPPSAHRKVEVPISNTPTHASPQHTQVCPHRPLAATHPEGIPPPVFPAPLRTPEEARRHRPQQRLGSPPPLLSYAFQDPIPAARTRGSPPASAPAAPAAPPGCPESVRACYARRAAGRAATGSRIAGSARGWPPAAGLARLPSWDRGLAPHVPQATAAASRRPGGPRPRICGGVGCGAAG